MKNFLKNYLYYTKAERNSALWLSAICIILYVIPFSYPYLFSDKKKYEFPPMPKRIKSYTAEKEGRNETKEINEFPFNPNNASREDFANLGLSDRLINTIFNYRNKGGKFYKVEDFQKIWGLSPKEFARLQPYIVIESYKNNHEKKTFDSAENVVEISEPFPFSPNLASIDDLLRLGIPKKVAHRMINYRSKGGVFRNKADVQKIYDFPLELFVKLEPFMVLEEMKPAVIVAQNTQNQANVGQIQSASPTSAPSYIPNNIPSAYDNTRFSKKNFSGNIDINQSSREQWQQLPGVGAGYANKIVNFRDKLGGFYTVEQVKETFGLPDSTFQKIKPFLRSSPVLKTININSVTQEELSSHPYCKFYQAKIIINYRNTNGKFANAEGLKKVYGVQDLLPKLLPYLNFN
jgi:competence ComEA-like helix-hairpin-helix protein